ncbi:endoplasmic reticulum vesicle transporter-domain-containing protein [Lactifluus subvellereus]|nr:endoplasmic reticulum vesicle transporter-domain-containing protein [Lactifluus subvellereus]
MPWASDPGLCHDHIVVHTYGVSRHIGSCRLEQRRKVLPLVNVTFPRVPCYYIIEEPQRDITHSVVKTRLIAAAAGTAVPGSQIGELRHDIDKLNGQRASGYCVNEVVGNIHITPRHSFRAAQSQIYDFVRYLKNDGNRHDFSHTIHDMYFTADDEADASQAQVSKEMRERLENLLDEHMARVRRLYFEHPGGLEASIQTSKAQYMLYYFLKIVSIQFRTLDGQIVNSHQYSVTHFERDLTTGQEGNTNEGLQIHHSAAGMPG